MSFRDLPRPAGVPPWKPSGDVAPEEARCGNCWAFERPAKPMSLEGLDKTILGTFDPEQQAELALFREGLGFCTLHPPATGVFGTDTQPLTHASHRCSQFTLRAVMQLKLQQARQMAAATPAAAPAGGVAPNAAEGGGTP